jgi:hypothetical protein
MIPREKPAEGRGVAINLAPASTPPAPPPCGSGAPRQSVESGEVARLRRLHADVELVVGLQ